ncbi:MAG: 8-amino-7-oxononanoate synthase [Trichlorobacter sp.]|nr:8-amino-7-oxononanoate synthase [Trichlorobacter sp.]
MSPQTIITERLNKVRQQGLARTIRTVSGTGPHTVFDDQQVLLLCSNNYLGLAEHPALKEAAIKAVQQSGNSSSASRLVSGSLPLHDQLEEAVASWKGTEAALIFNSGYAANTGIISALAGKGDLIFSDRLNHASIIDGAMFSGAKLIRYPHNDTNTLAQLLAKHETNGLRLIVTDTVFSMDGDLAKLQQLTRLAKEHNTLLMVDDAHGSGILAEEGRGCCHLLGEQGGVHLLMGTFGKALGSFGAYLATSHLIRDYLINRARPLIFSTSLPPSVLAASMAAIKLVRSDEGAQLRHKLTDNISFFRNSLSDQGFSIPHSPTPIIPLIIGDPELTMSFSAQLLEQKIWVQGIRPPTVPAGTSRLRCTVMASHSKTDLQTAAVTIGNIGRKLGII